MGLFTYRAQIERRLQDINADLSRIERRLADLESQEFALSELRRQARNAVRSLERATANAEEARRGPNGHPARVEVPPPPIDPPGPRRNY